METSHYKAENGQMIEVEIYETGEKTLIAAQRHIADKGNSQDRSIIMTAAEYANFKAGLSNQDM